MDHGLVIQIERDLFRKTGFHFRRLALGGIASRLSRGLVQNEYRTVPEPA
jgi:hypothetical protein